MTPLRPPRWLQRWLRFVGALLVWLCLPPLTWVMLVLTLPRTYEPLSGRGVEIAALAPWGVPASLTLLAACLAATWLSRRVFSFIGALLSVLSLVPVAFHIAWIAPLYVGGVDAASSGPELVVMTQNLEYGDASSLARVASANAVDVLVICDLTPDQRVDVLETGLPRRLRYSAGTDRGSLVLSRYPISGDTFISGGGDSRSLEIHTPQLGVVTLVALHPTPPYQGTKWAHDYGEIEDRLAHLTPGSPRILAGDLNATLDHLPLRQIQSLGYRDAVERTNGGFQPTFPAPGAIRRWGLPVPPLVQIDHILVSDALTVLSVKNLAVDQADHLGVVAVIGNTATATTSGSERP